MRLSAWVEADEILGRGIEMAIKLGETPYPLLHYYRAFAADRLGEISSIGRGAIEAARNQDLKIEIFPFRREDIRVLSRILELEHKDANAASLLADILYSRERHSEALAQWYSALEASPAHFMALRDLGLALLEEGNRVEALQLLTKASQLRPDHLQTTLLVAGMYARMGDVQSARQAFERALQRKPGHDLLIEKLISLEAQMGNYQQALESLTRHNFEPRHQSYSLLYLYQGVRLMLVLQSLEGKKMTETLEHIQAASHPPSNLGVDDFVALEGPRLRVFEALIHTANKDSKSAAKAWKLAAQTVDDEIEGEGLFRAIALQKVGETKKVEEWMRSFSSINEQRKTDNAIELRTQAHYLAGIQAVFEGKNDLARENFHQALEVDQSYLFARQALAWLDAGSARLSSEVKLTRAKRSRLCRKAQSAPGHS